MKIKKRGFTLQELLIVLWFVGLALAFLLDVSDNAPFQARAHSCRSNLKALGVELSLYRGAHRGQMPLSLKELPAVKNSGSGLLECLETGYSTRDGAYFSYAYRRPSRPQPRDIIVWDVKPHIPMHSVFKWMNRPFRQVLRVDGSVSRLSEEEFEQLNLSGTSERIR